MNELNEQLSVKSTIDNVLLESLYVSEEINSIQGETTLYGQVEKIVTTYRPHANTTERRKNKSRSVANTFNPCLRKVEVVACRRA